MREAYKQEIRNSSGRDWQKAAARIRLVSSEQGFTLLEMMVVLLIAGILITVTSLQIRRNSSADLTEQAQRLALLFEVASDKAEIEDRQIVWQLVDGGYRFGYQSTEGLLPLNEDVLRERHWEGGVAGATITVSGTDQNATQVVFGRKSFDVAVNVTLVSTSGHATITRTGIGSYEVR